MNTYLAAQRDPLKVEKAAGRDLKENTRKKKKKARWDQSDFSRARHYIPERRDLSMTTGIPR